MAGTAEHQSEFDQDIAPRSAGRHGSTGSRPDVSEAQHSHFQESATSVNCIFGNTSTEFGNTSTDFVNTSTDLLNDLADHGVDLLWSLFDYNVDGHEIETSVNVNEEKPEDNDLKPRIGMTFSSETEAEKFYKNYAEKTGFKVRKGKVIKQPNGTLKWRRFLCSCEGFRAKKQSNQGTKYQRLETRTGCGAQMEVTLQDERWVITQLHLDHDHRGKNSDESSDKSIQDAVNGPSEKVEGSSEADKVCPKYQQKLVKSQAVDSRRAKGETSLSPAEAEDRDKTLKDLNPAARRFIGDLLKVLQGNLNSQRLEELTSLQSKFHLLTKNLGYLSQQTQEESVSSYLEQSMAKAGDEVETPCNYVQNASDQLTMEERSLEVAKSSDEGSGLPFVPTIYSAQVPTMNDASHWIGGSSVSIASSTVPTPTLPVTVMTSASTPATGNSNPHLPCLQGKRSRVSKDQRTQCTSSGGANTIVQVKGSGVGFLSQQTQEESVSSYLERSMAKAGDEVETTCNYVQNASDQLTMEERSLAVAKSADEGSGLPFVPTIYSAQVPTMNDTSHYFQGSTVSIASSTVPTPHPVMTMTSASTPKVGNSSPHLPCLQGKCSGVSKDQRTQCTSSGGVKTIVQVEESGVGYLSQQTQEESVSSHLEQSMTKAGDEVMTPCNYVQNASDQLTMEERSLAVAKNADDGSGLPFVPTIYSAQVPTMNDASHYFQGSTVSIASSTVPTPTHSVMTMTSASTPEAGNSSPHLSCLQGKCSGVSKDQRTQCTSSGEVNTIVQVEGSGVFHTSELIWRQILTKYGDITAKCTLKSPEFVAFVKQSILKIVELMQTNTARGLSDENISTIGRMLGDLEGVQVKVDWLRTRFVAVGHVIDYAKAKDNRDMILRNLKAKNVELEQLQQHLSLQMLHVTQLLEELKQVDSNLLELQHRVPKWLTIEDTLGKGLL